MYYHTKPTHTYHIRLAIFQTRSSSFFMKISSTFGSAQVTSGLTDWK